MDIKTHTAPYVATLSKLQARTRLSRALLRLLAVCWPGAQSA